MSKTVTIQIEDGEVKIITDRKTEEKDIFTNKKKPLYLYLLVDESTSMESNKKQVISGLNELVEGRKKFAKDEDVPVYVTLVKFSCYNTIHGCTNFDSWNGWKYDKVTKYGDKWPVKVIYANKNIEEVEKFNSSNYSPNGNTALNDAVVYIIKEAKKDLRHLDDYVAVFVIQTDGEENSSQKYKEKRKIKEMIEEMENTDKCTFIFLGADINAWDEGRDYGFCRGNTLSYRGRNTDVMYCSVGGGMDKLYSSGLSHSKNFVSDYLDDIDIGNITQNNINTTDPTSNIPINTSK